MVFSKAGGCDGPSDPGTSRGTLPWGGSWGGVAFREQLTLVRSSMWVSSLHMMGRRETTPFPPAWHLGRVTSSPPPPVPWLAAPQQHTAFPAAPEHGLRSRRLLEKHLCRTQRVVPAASGLGPAAPCHSCCPPMYPTGVPALPGLWEGPQGFVCQLCAVGLVLAWSALPKFSEESYRPGFQPTLGVSCSPRSCPAAPTLAAATASAQRCQRCWL